MNTSDIFVEKGKKIGIEKAKKVGVRNMRMRPINTIFERI